MYVNSDDPVRFCNRGAVSNIPHMHTTIRNVGMASGIRSIAGHICGVTAEFKGTGPG